ncbi:MULTISPECIES: hypothetical protein [Bacillus]|uniref:hypothetical protein n=1 Tax=Bacillus TaxID=1386 RepID=UPI000BB86000|nr:MULTISPECIES: hypothetical protein [Bacillus]
MALHEVWAIFLRELKHEHENSIVHCYRKDITGIPFLYVETNPNVNCMDILSIIEKCAKIAMYKKRITSRTKFVRKQDGTCVFRHRFYVPQEKMFCCGNFCEDCILKRNKH